MGAWIQIGGRARVLPTERRPRAGQMAPFADDRDPEDAWHRNLEEIVVPRELLLPLARSVNRKLTTLCPVFDAWLRGGVPTRSVTEIVGEAGAAKTQFALQLLLAAQLPSSMGGLDGAAVYVHTEGRAPLTRLKQLVERHPKIREFFVRHPEKTKRGDETHDFFNHVYVVETLDDPDGLWTALTSVDALLKWEGRGGGGGKERRAFAPRTLESRTLDVPKKIKLIVVDSVSSPFREDDASAARGAAARAHALARIAALLREYAHRYDLCVVVTNHVVDVVEDGDAVPGETRAARVSASASRRRRQRRLFGPSGEMSSSGRRVAPSLGLFWANCVNTRMFLSRTCGAAGGGFGGGKEKGESGARREASIVFSSHLPPSRGDDGDDGGGGGGGGGAVRFEVRENGVWGIPDDRGT